MNDLRSFARSLGLSFSKSPSYDELIDGAALLYWQRRPRPPQRRRRQLRQVAPTPVHLTEAAGIAACGTRAAAERHRKRGEMCPPCQQALDAFMAAYDADRRGRRRTAAVA